MHANLIQAEETLDDLILGGLKIIQPIKGYRFSIDAVLLAHFADLHGVKRVVDLGTGNGVIPLLLSHRDPGINILGIELQPGMADRAGRSVQLNNLQHRIDILQADIRKLKELPGGSAELVLSNPPYWKRGEGHVNRNHEESIARHEIEVTLKELVEGALHLLAPQGALALIHRVERLDEIAYVFGQLGLSLSRVRKVQSYADRPARQVLVEARFGRRHEMVLMPPLIIYSKLNCYGDELRQLYGEA